MKIKNICRNRQPLYTALGILCVILLFGLAVIFPKYYCRFYDNNTLNKVAFTDVNVDTYETSYDSFAEKLYAMAQAHEKNPPLRAVLMNELGMSLSAAELTNIANKEMKTLYRIKALKEKLTLKAKRLTLTERYTIYGNNTLLGINCWKLTYETSKRKIILYLDEEFHKILFLQVSYTNSAIYATDGETSGSSAIDKMYSKLHSERFYTWWACMSHYYNLTAYSEKPVSCMTGSTIPYSFLRFDNKYDLIVVNDRDYNEYRGDNSGWSMGIMLEKMIQF